MPRLMPRRSATLLAIVFLLGAAPSSEAKPRDPAHAITSQLICPCSCGEVLSGCTCETGKTMQGYVENAIKQGKGKDQIVGALVARYGEVIRGAPKPEGFNLLVWVLPFAATLAGFAIAFLVLRRMVRRRAVIPTSQGALVADRGGLSPGRTLEDDLEALRARAEAELRRMRE